MSSSLSSEWMPSPERVKRVAGLVEIERRKCEQIESCLHQLRVTDHDLDALLQLLLIPELALERGDGRAQDRDTETCAAKH
jgi:hypothetical protein